MPETSEPLECHVSANLLLEAAHQIFSCGNSPLSLVLLDAVLGEYPDHAHAALMRRIYTESMTPPKKDALDE